MIELFHIPQQDQSIYFLGQIFGYVGDVYAVSNAPLLLGIMFKTLNTTALVLGAILVVHTTVVGLLKTASEGEFLGKWSSLWVPLRTVMGIAGLFPTATGYSIIQVIIMWIIVQGIGAADTLWTAVLNYVNLAGSPYASISIPSLAVDRNMQQLFQNVTCQVHALEKEGLLNKGGSTPESYYYCASSQADSTFCGNSSITSLATGNKQLVQSGTNTVQVSTGGSSLFSSGANSTSTINMLQYNFGPVGSNGAACGTMTFGDPDTSAVCQAQGSSAQLTCAGLKAQKTALIAILNFYAGIAGMFEEADKEYISFYENQPLSTANTTTNTPGGAKAPVTAPEWVQNYCNGQSGASKTASCVAGSSDLPSDTIASPVDFGNTSNTAINMYWTYYVQPKLGGPADFISAATNMYIGSVIQGVQNHILSQPPSTLSGWQADAEHQGWITAGTYYYQMAKMNSNNLAAAMPTLNVTAPEPNITASSANNGAQMAQFRNNYLAVTQIFSSLAKQNNTNSNSSMSVSLPPSLQQVGDAFSSSGSAIISSFMSTLTGSGPGGQVSNPLASLANLGEALMITAQVLYSVILVLAIVIITVVEIRPFVLGDGEIDGAAVGMATVFMLLMPILLAFVTVMIGIGATLGVYVPLIPYVVYTFGVIGWITASIEAMVAGPFIALGIMSPSGQHEIMGKAEHSIMIILNLFLRPSMMVMGLMVAMLMAGVVVTMINAGFMGVMNSINGAPGPLELVLFLCAYAFLIVAALNKCFALIYLLPSKILTYIGGQAISFGEEEGLQAVKGGVEAGSGKMQGLAAGTVPDKRQMPKPKKDEEQIEGADNSKKKPPAS